MAKNAMDKVCKDEPYQMNFKYSVEEKFQLLKNEEKEDQRRSSSPY